MTTITNVVYVGTGMSRQMTSLAESSSVRAARNRVVVAGNHACWRSWAGSNSRVTAEHGDARAVLGAPKRDHVLANVAAHKLAVVCGAVGENVLDKVVAELVTSNCILSAVLGEKATKPTLTVNQWHAGTVGPALADALQVTIQELAVTNLETFLNHLGSILVGAVLGSEAKNVVDGTASVSGSSVFADVLDAPVSELAMGDDINASKDFVDTGSLVTVSNLYQTRKSSDIPCLPRGSSQRCSAPPDCPSRRELPHATCHEGPR